jgi:hypothetical protein
MLHAIRLSNQPKPYGLCTSVTSVHGVGIMAFPLQRAWAMRRWMLVLIGGIVLMSSASADTGEVDGLLGAEHRRMVQRWVATLPAAWRPLDWPALIEELATPLPENGGGTPYLRLWLPSLFKHARIPGPNDPPVIVLTPSCECSSGVLEVALVWQDGRLERLPAGSGLRGVQFEDGALDLRFDLELAGDANCCPSVIEQRLLRWVDRAPVWRTQYLPGEIQSTTGCWHAARLVDADNARWVEIAALGIPRHTLQQRLFACSRDPEQEQRRVRRLGPGLHIALDEGPIQIVWNAAAQRWEVTKATDP